MVEPGSGACLLACFIGPGRQVNDEEDTVTDSLPPACLCPSAPLPWATRRVANLFCSSAALSWEKCCLVSSSSRELSSSVLREASGGGARGGAREVEAGRREGGGGRRQGGGLAPASCREGGAVGSWPVGLV